MIHGTVNSRREAVLALRVIGPAGAVIVPTVIDTGFSGLLTLSPAVAGSIGLPVVGRGFATLADGSVEEHDVYRADVDWFGSPRRVLVASADGDALVGMALLADCELRVEVKPGGAVEVKRLS